MITKEHAQSLALEIILKNWRVENDEPIITDKFTIERDFGWVFFYSSRRYLETKNYRHLLAGNAPIIVNKFDASVHITGTAREAEYYIADYEKTLTNKKQS